MTFSHADREYLAEKGLCANCGKRPPTPGYASCGECRQKSRDNARSRVAERVRIGVCSRCGKRQATQGFKTCAVCRETVRKYMQEYKKGGAARKS